MRLGKETLATLEGYWDNIIYIKDRRTGVSYYSQSFFLFFKLSFSTTPFVFIFKEQQVLWYPASAIQNRLVKYTVAFDQQGEHESEKLWQHVSAAILRDDMNAATEEKTNLEETQRGEF